MQKISAFLWFNNQAEEAAKFYISVFKNSKITYISRYSEPSAKASGRPNGSVMTVALELQGQPFVLLNGGPHFKFTEAISFVIYCDTQKDLDRFWDRLSAGGEKGRCGWLKDKYGVSWQVVPTILPELLSDDDGEKSIRVMEAILRMDKIDIKTLKRA